MPKTLTLRLSEEESGRIENLMRNEGIATASKLVMYAVEQFPILQEKNIDLYLELQAVRRERDVYLQAIDSAREAAQLLVDRCAQSEMDI